MNTPQLSKSKLSLVDAFKTLVITRPYEDIHVADIIRQADLSRSTFYEHFSSKEEILRTSLQDAVRIWSTAGFPGFNQDAMTRLVQHFQDVRPLSTIYLNTGIALIVTELLADEISSRQMEGSLSKSSFNKLHDLATYQIASSQIGLIRHWLKAPGTLGARQIANQLHESAKALLKLTND